MIEALWSAEFRSNVGAVGTGVVVFETGRLFGGDNQYFYLGSYEATPDTVKGSVEIEHYAGPGWSIFGAAKKLRLELDGRLGPDVMELTGRVPDFPALQMTVVLTRRAALP